MEGREAYKARARISGGMNGQVWKATLKNGHSFVAHGSRNWPVPPGSLQIGDEVEVVFSPFDMGKAMIIRIF